MNRTLCRFMLLGCTVFAALDASAQAPAALQVLALPEGQTMICRAPDVSPGDPPQLRALVRREFVVAPPSASGLPPGFPVVPPREIMVAWDSSGSPRMLNDQAAQPLDDATSVLALFGSNGAASGRHIFLAVDHLRLAAALASGDPARATDPGLLRPPVSRDLTIDEGTQARALAIWLWARRCLAQSPAAPD